MRHPNHQQKEQIARATGVNVSALELSPEALEERIAPMAVTQASVWKYTD